MGQFDQVIDWFKQHHDALIDDLAPLQSGLRNVMEFDGSEWHDVTPTLIAETRGRIAELELLVRIYEARNNPPAPELRLVGGRNSRAGPA